MRAVQTAEYSIAKMNKSDLLARIRAVQKELDELFDAVLSLENEEKVQALQVQSDDDGWMTVAQICKELHISDSTFYDWLNQGLLPPGLEFGPRSKRWKMSDIQIWQKERVKHCDSCEAAKNTKRKRGRPSRVMKLGTFVHA